MQWEVINGAIIPNGEYRILASAELSNGLLAYDFADIKIDDSLSNNTVNLIEFSGIKKSDLKDVAILEKNNKVYAVLNAPANHKIEAYWNSVLLTSTVLADSSTGLAYVELPQWFDYDTNQNHRFISFVFNWNCNCKNL